MRTELLSELMHFARGIGIYLRVCLCVCFGLRRGLGVLIRGESLGASPGRHRPCIGLPLLLRTFLGYLLGVLTVYLGLYSLALGFFTFVPRFPLSQLSAFAFFRAPVTCVVDAVSFNQNEQITCLARLRWSLVLNEVERHGTGEAGEASSRSALKRRGGVCHDYGVVDVWSDTTLDVLSQHILTYVDHEEQSENKMLTAGKNSARTFSPSFNSWTL